MAIDSGGNVSDLVLARNCCLARMLPGEGPYAIGIQNTHQVRYLLQLLAAVVCAANCRRIVCAVIEQSSHGVCGSISNRRRRLYRRRSSGQQKLHGVCLALASGLHSHYKRLTRRERYAPTSPCTHCVCFVAVVTQLHVLNS